MRNLKVTNKYEYEALKLFQNLGKKVFKNISKRYFKLFGNFLQRYKNEKRNKFSLY